MEESVLSNLPYIEGILRKMYGTSFAGVSIKSSFWLKCLMFLNFFSKKKPFDPVFWHSQRCVSDSVQGPKTQSM